MLFDYYKKESEVALKIFKNLIDKIEKNKTIKFSKVNEHNSLFFPSLNTNINGWIDWQNWNSQEIVNFINAFGFPHKGASTKINNLRIYIKHAIIFKLQEFHPFQYGIITKIDERGLYVIAKDAIILIKKYKLHSKKNFLIKTGYRLFTPIKILQKALNHMQKV